jgi:uncharacterized protein (DUF58 family)
MRPFGWLLSRLSREGRALASITCAAGVFGADVGRGESHLLVLASLSLMVSALVFTRAYRLSGVRAEILVPRRVTVGDEITIAIQVHNDSSKPHQRIRIEPPRLPWDGRYTMPPGEIEQLASLGKKSTLCKARFSARGEHQLDAFSAAALLPLGLSQGAPVATAGARFVVVPKVARVTSLNTSQKRRHQPGGVSLASRTGDATDLLGVRPYRMGDPLRDLHARSWARHGAPMVREYQEEYFTRIGVVADTDAKSSSSAHLEGALSLAAGVVARLCGGEALVDVLVAGQHAERLSLGRSLGSLDQALDVLAAVRADGGFAASKLLSLLAPHLSRLSSIVFVAITWNEARAAFVSTLEARGLRCVVLVVGDHAEHCARFTRVPLSAIMSGQELVL